MALTFPTNPSDGDTYQGFTYSSERGAWNSTTFSSSVPEDISDLTDTTNLIPDDISDLTDTTNLIPGDISDLTDTGGLLSSGSGGGVTTYSLVSDLPASASSGDLAYVTDNQRIYLWNGSLWFHVLTAETPNTAPFFTTQPKVGYSLATDGTPLEITLNATDPEGTAITWDYTVTGGSIGNTATISVSNNTYTITPSTDTANAGVFELTFTASDGLHVANSNSTYISLIFSYDWASISRVVESTIHNPVNPTSEVTYTNGDTGTLRFGASMKFWKPNELIIGSPGINSVSNGGIWVYDTSYSPPTLTAQYISAGGMYGGNGSAAGMIVDANDDWLISVTDENGTNNNPSIHLFKRNASGGFDTTGTEKRLTRDAWIGVSAAVNNIYAAIDENSNTIVFVSDTDDVEIFENTSGTTWSSVTGTSLNGAYGDPYTVDILDHYMIIGSTTGIHVYIKDPTNGWQKNQVYTNFPNSYFYPAYVKLFNYNGTYHIVTAMGAVPSYNLSVHYHSAILKIDESSKTITQYRTHVGSNVLYNPTSTSEDDISGNLFNYNFVDSYVSGDYLHIAIAESTNPSGRVTFIKSNLSGVTTGNTTGTRSLSNDPWGSSTDMTTPHCFAMDRFTGKLAVSESTYGSLATNAGKVWITRE